MSIENLSKFVKPDSHEQEPQGAGKLLDEARSFYDMQREMFQKKRYFGKTRDVLYLNAQINNYFSFLSEEAEEFNQEDLRDLSRVLYPIMNDMSRLSSRFHLSSDKVGRGTSEQAEQVYKNGLDAMSHLIVSSLKKNDSKDFEFQKGEEALIDSYKSLATKSNLTANSSLLRTLENNDKMLLSYEWFELGDEGWREKALPIASEGIENVLQGELIDDDDLYEVAGIYSHLFNSGKEYHRESITKVLEQMGISDAEEMFRHWRFRDGLVEPEEQAKRERKNVQNHFYNIYKIFQSSGTEGIKKMHKKYGIVHFGRYTADQLLEQANHSSEDEKKKHVVTMYPHGDHNNSFSSAGNILEDLQEELGDDYEVVITEVASQRDIFKKMIAVKNEYGSVDKKPQLVMFGAHGSKESITLDQANRRYVDADEMRGKEVESIDTLLDKDASIVIHACDVGKEGGFAEATSQFFSRRVIAPNVSSGGIKDLNITLDESGNINDVDVSFNPSFSAETGTMQTKTYESDERA